MNKIRIILFSGLLINEIQSQSIFCYSNSDSSSHEQIMHIDESKEGNLVFCSINWDYNINPSFRYSKLVLMDSSCNLIKELKIEYPLFNSKIFRIFSLDTGYIALGVLSLKSQPNQFKIQLLSLNFEFEITKEYILDLPLNIEPYWIMGKKVEQDRIVVSVNLSKYPAPIAGGTWLNLFIHFDWNQSFINYKYYQPGNSSGMADDIDKDKISEGFIGSGSVNLKIDKNLNVIDSIESPWFFNQLILIGVIHTILLLQDVNQIHNVLSFIN